MRATCSVHVILLYLVNNTDYESPHCVFFSILLSPHVAVATFSCGPSHDLRISQYEKGNNFLILRRTLIYI
jgi:hypothetical protein